MVEQGGATEVIEIKHPADQDPVVPGIDGFMQGTLKACRAALQQRGPSRPLPEVDAAELVRLGTGELVGDVDLIGGENIDGEMVRAADHVQAVHRALVQAPEDQRGLQGDRVEAVDRQPDPLPFGALAVTTVIPVAKLPSARRRLWGSRAESLIVIVLWWVFVSTGDRFY